MSDNRKLPRGVLQGQEIRNNNWRDSRTMGQKFNDSLEKPSTTFTIMLVVTSIMVVYPAMLEVAFLIGMLLLYKINKKKISLPFRMPMSSNMIDYNFAKPNGQFGLGTGIIFLGNELGTNKELWFSDDDARTHFLIFGSTGAGKALKMNEKVLTSEGWKENKDLKVGDYVIRPNGEWSKIVGIFPQGLSQLYRMEFEDGRSKEITSEHLWEIYNYKDISSKNELNGEVVNTFKIKEKLDSGEDLAINMVGKIEGKEALLSSDMDSVIYNSIINSVKNNKFDDDISLILNGSYSQREYFFYQYKSEIKQQLGFSISHFSYDLIGFKSKDNAELIQKIAHSLGLYAKLVNKEELGFTTYNLNEELTHFLYIKEVDFLRVSKIENLNRFEECQCIKIEAADGLFIIEDYIVTHNTETLLSLAFNTLVHGSGFTYIDGKGDNTLFMKVFSMVRSMGREDDLLVLNYMTGSRDVSGPQRNKLSNTLNPLSTGTSNGLTELIVGLMGGSGGGNGDMWKGRAVAMIGAVMRALVWQRENAGLLLDVVQLRDALLLENIEKLSRDPNLPPDIINSIMAYLQSLPGYVTGSDTQEGTVLEQHGFLQMQFTRILGSLSDDYGYIFKTDLGEIDFKDVILNNRILCVLLPAMEKSVDELANLGKIVVACLKIMMSSGLGDTLEGETARIIDIKPTNSLSPYMCILDEYGYYVVTGAAVMPAQARSIGFSMVFAGQDLPSFKKNNNAEEAAATIGNCNIKIFMKIEDPGDTFDLAKKSAGEATVARSTQQERNTGLIGTSYNDTTNISNNKESRLDWLDVKDQKQGQAHIIFTSIMIRAATFYANPQKPKYLRLNHFIRVRPPTRLDMEEYTKPIINLEKHISNKTLMDDIFSRKEDITLRTFGGLIKELDNYQTLSSDQKFAAFIAANAKNQNNLINQFVSETESNVFDVEDGTVNIFTSASKFAEGDDDENMEGFYSEDNISKVFSNHNDQSPLIKDNEFAKQVYDIESISSNNNEDEINDKCNQLINDVAKASSYPNKDTPIPSGTTEQFDINIDQLLQAIQ